MDSRRIGMRGPLSTKCTALLLLAGLAAAAAWLFTPPPNLRPRIDR